MTENKQEEKPIFYLDVSHRSLCKISRSPSHGYSIARYDKSLLQKDTNTTYGLWRSVIFPNDTEEVVCFAPPKSISPNTFLEKTARADMVAQEFVEGTMINVFWDNRNHCWEMATRSIVGAANTFFAKTPVKTFREMFMEAAAETKLNLEELDKKHCYSFVLQHPENRIVLSFHKPHLYLVAAYTIMSAENGRIKIVVEDVRSIALHQNQSTVSLPAVYAFETVEELIHKYCSWETPYTIMGVVIYNQATGERTKLRNPHYEYVRHLRGNQSKLEYQYLTLRKERKVGNYLTYYPEHTGVFQLFRTQVHSFTKALHYQYVQCFILKQTRFPDILPLYKHHVYQLHKLYLTELKEKKQSVTMSVVIPYVNQLHPAHLMYSLHYTDRPAKV